MVRTTHSQKIVFRALNARFGSLAHFGFGLRSAFLDVFLREDRRDRFPYDIRGRIDDACTNCLTSTIGLNRDSRDPPHATAASSETRVIRRSRRLVTVVSSAAGVPRT
jgi:hypothetical protein